MQQDIPGTTVFDGEQAQKGLALNRMCFSFNSADNRAGTRLTRSSSRAAAQPNDA